MTKNELIKAIQNEVDIEIPQKDVSEIFDALISVIINEVKNGGEVILPGICRINSKTVAAKSGVSKLSGVEIPWSNPEHRVGATKVFPSFKNLFE